MKIAANTVGGLLGLAFVAFSIMFFLGMGPKEAPEPGSPVALFMGAFGPTHYMTFVKVCELVGGILVAIPLTRNFGLLILGPVIINIVAFHVFVGKVSDIFNPPIVLILGLMALFLLWTARGKFLALKN